jgi:hypothetical protein
MRWSRSYHADHRELCAHERDWPFEVRNVLEIVGASMGLAHEDSYKRLKLKQDVDAIVADCADLAAQHGLDPPPPAWSCKPCSTTSRSRSSVKPRRPLPGGS